MTEPTRRERLRPLELIGMSAIIGVAFGVITYFAIRDLLVAVEVLAGAFIVSLVVFAMLLLAVTPPKRDDDRSSPH
jgi:VIT1/CCC1 family predicted Fe2+/Mn2+ transporter